jgi:hypothetical protein
MVLIIAFLTFEILFKDGGILRNGYNAVAKNVNRKYCQMTEGKDDCQNKLIAEWKRGGAENLEKADADMEIK